MACDYIALANEGVRGLSPYQAGKPIEELQRELGLEHIVKLASNENPLPPGEKVLAAIARASQSLFRYPDSNGFELKAALSERLGVDANQITLGNGSNDLLELIARAYIEPGKSSVSSEYAFFIYQMVAKACGGRAIITKAKGWGHDLNAMADAIGDDTRLVYIANPNNPTGTMVDESALVDFLDKVPANVIVVLDEAYYEYASYDAREQGVECPNGVALLKYYPNLVVTRTFSKAYGLAGARVGFAVSSPEISDILNRVRAPFNVNSMAFAAAQAVLEDTAYLEESCRINRVGKAQLEAGLKALGLAYIPSAGNFLAVEFATDTAVLYQRLLQQGMIVRPIANYGMPKHLRITVGLEHENTQLLAALKKVL